LFDELFSLVGNFLIFLSFRDKGLYFSRSLCDLGTRDLRVNSHDLDFLSGNFKTAKTVLKFENLRLNFLALVIKDLIESFKQFNEVSGSDVEDTL
jgi:hypothetical protein